MKRRSFLGALLALVAYRPRRPRYFYYTEHLWDATRGFYETRHGRIELTGTTTDDPLIVAPAASMHAQHSEHRRS